MIRDMLRSPEGFRSDPYGYATNQCGHFVLGLYGAMCLGILPTLAAYLVWEAVQILRFDGEWRDSVEDTAFVAAGVFHPLSAIIFPVMLLYGVWRRLQQEEQRQE